MAPPAAPAPSSTHTCPLHPAGTQPALGWFGRLGALGVLWLPETKATDKRLPKKITISIKINFLEFISFGGPCGSRTRYLRIANAALYRLS